MEVKRIFKSVLLILTAGILVSCGSGNSREIIEEETTKRSARPITTAKNKTSEKNAETTTVLESEKEIEEIDSSTTNGIKWSVSQESLSLGYNHSAAISENGDLYTWGENHNGELGNGISGGTIYKYDEGIDSSLPLKIMDNAKSVNLGTSASAALTQDSELYTWGAGLTGMLLGSGKSEDCLFPEKIMDNVINFSLGSNAGGAITQDGILYTWGENKNGEVGTKIVALIPSPNVLPVEIMNNVSWVDIGGSHASAITYDGSLYLWGDDMYGQIGDSEGNAYDTRTKIMDNVVSVSLGTYHSAAITDDGSLYMWGNNFNGQLGIETPMMSLTPIKVLDDVISISLGGVHSGAITEDGALYMWGDNSHGQLGNGTNENSPVPIKILDNVASVSLGKDFSAAITKDGDLYTWGNNESGQLGIGTTESSNVPVKVNIPEI